MTLTAEEQRRKDIAEAADRRYRQLCRLLTLEDLVALDAAATPRRRPVTRPAVKPTVTRPATRKQAELPAMPVIHLPRGGDGRPERRYLCWYTGANDER
jgi:hypothetical protein